MPSAPERPASVGSSRRVHPAYGHEVSAFTLLERLPLGRGIEHLTLEARHPGVPPSLDGLRIGFLTDLHYSLRAPFHRQLREWTIAREVDLWLIGGDLYESAQGEARLAELCAGLTAPLGCYVVPGNNDNRVFGASGPVAAFERLGLRPLVNEGLRLERDGGSMWLAGTDDPSRARDDLDRALRGVRQDEGILLLSHAPDVIFRAAERGASLVLTGHTHGGQVCLPGIGALWAGTRTRGCGRRMASGAVGVGQTAMWVSRGTGDSLLPFRFHCPAEVTTLILRAGRAS